MAYIGRDLDNGLLTRQTFTANGSTTEFTLDQYVSDATQLLVSVAGVIQEPNVAFTASDNTLTFTGAPANGAAVWAIYLGKTISVTGTSGAGSINVQTGTGNGSATPVTLSNSVTTEAEIFVSLNGIAQLPGTDYTASGTTLTFSTSPTAADAILIYYFSSAGILNVVADGAVTTAGFAASGTWPAWNGNAITNLDSSDLSGTLPAINSSNLTGLVEGLDTISSSDPTVTTNPSSVGTMWLNSSSGELYCCTSATTNDNVWTNVGGGAGHIQAPTNPNDTFPDLTESTTTNFTFAGGTDDGTVTHYMVDQISNTSVLGVTTSEVAAGSAHSFVTQAVGSDTSVTFRVRTKDNLGLYSPGITVTTIVQNIVYTVATGGDNNSGNGEEDGDYKYHIFNGTGTFTVSQVGTDATIDYLVVGGGGSGNSGNPGGGGGAGGLRTTTGTSGRNSSAESKPTVSATSYTMTIGGGAPFGAGGDNNDSRKGTNSNISGLNITSQGGGYAGSLSAAYSQNGGPGGSGGGACTYFGMSAATGGTGTAGQGFDGGDATNSGFSGAGGGGAGGGVTTANGSSNAPTAGGVGLSNSITGSGIFYAGGGGGGCDNGQTPAAGGSGVGGTGGAYLGTAGNGTVNRGGGGGGGGSNGGSGGSGIIIVRYKFK